MFTDDIKLDDNQVFYAHESDADGEYYYYVARDGDKYIFESGKKDLNNRKIDSSLQVSTKTLADYKNFIYDLKEMTQDWERDYQSEDDNSFCWSIDLIYDDRTFNGLNSYPSNYEYVMEFIDSAFNNRKNNPLETVSEETVTIEIQNDKSDYLMILSKYRDNTASMCFVNREKLKEIDPNDTMISISPMTYNKFYEKLMTITKDWKIRYTGEKNINWDITIENQQGEVCILGDGAYPKDWNIFMDLLIEYEIMFKNKKRF